MDNHAAGRQAICFRVDSPTMEAAERAAAQEGLSLASVARRALLNDLRHRNGAALSAQPAAA